MNFKQDELIDEILDAIKKQYPEGKLISVAESSEDPQDLWISVTAPEDEDREIEMREFASDKATDVFLDYGYHFSIIPRKTNSLPTSA